MERFAIGRQDKITKAYYEIERSNQNALYTLRNYVCHQSRQMESAVGKSIHKFQQTRSPRSMKTALSACTRSFDENIAAVRKNVTKHPGTSLGPGMQELNLFLTTLRRDLTKYFSLQGYKF